MLSHVGLLQDSGILKTLLGEIGVSENDDEDVGDPNVSIDEGGDPGVPKVSLDAIPTSAAATAIEFSVLC